MSFNFEFFLTTAVVVSGAIALVDVLVFAPTRRRRKSEHRPVLIEYAYSFFPIL